MAMPRTWNAYPEARAAMLKGENGLLKMAASSFDSEFWTPKGPIGFPGFKLCEFEAAPKRVPSYF